MNIYLKKKSICNANGMEVVYCAIKLLDGLGRYIKIISKPNKTFTERLSFLIRSTVCKIKGMARI